MAITPISASNSAVTATQAVRPPPISEAQRAQQQQGNQPVVGNIAPPPPPPPKPYVNAQGQTTGTLVNTTA